MSFPTPRSAAAAVAALLLAAVPALAGCEREPERELSKRSSVAVELPPTPDLAPKQLLTRYPDGALTVAGVVREAGRLIGQEVEVRGTVAEVHLCPKAPPVDMDTVEGDVIPTPKAPPCHPPPHMLLGERLDDTRGRILVVGSERTLVGTAKVGELVTVKGLFDQVSPGGQFIRQSGLVVLPEPPPEEPAEPDADAGP